MSPLPWILAFVVTAFACRMLARHAGRLHLLDLPDTRKQHAGAVPTVGGLAVLVGFGLACLLSGHGRLLGEMAGATLLMLAVGLVDDARNLPAGVKLACQVAAGTWLVWGTGAALHSLPLPFFHGHLPLGWAAGPLTVLMIVTVLNAINLIDGLDGLAGGCLSIALVVLAMAAVTVGRWDLAEFATLLCAAVMGFLVWNARWPWQPQARVFLGDAGALAVGMLLCWLILKLSLSWEGYQVKRVPLTVALAPVAVPVIDLFVVAFWRMAEGRNPMQADRGHSHHLLLEMGLSTAGAVRLIWGAALAIALSTTLAWRMGVAEGRLLGVLLMGSLTYLAVFRLGWLKVRRALRSGTDSQDLSAASEPPSGHPRVLFISTGLGVGGAERALECLLPHLVAQGVTVAVVSLREPQPVGERLRALGMEVYELGMKPSRPSLRGLFGLWRRVRAFRPDVIQGWMYHGNLAAHVARLAMPQAKVVLGLHQTLARLDLESRTTRAVIRLDAYLSRWASRVIHVAQAAVSHHEAAGYAPRAVVLPNGIDTDRFRPDPVAAAALRKELGVGPEALVIGMVGRHHPAKNHEGFLRAAALVAAEYPRARFLLCGADVSSENPALASLLNVSVLEGKVLALGSRSDVPALLACCDLYVLSSVQEALPNVVAEAMSCGVPCVVTDVGDAAWMIGETGWLVPAGDDRALAAGIIRALGAGCADLTSRGKAARQRIVTKMDVARVAARYVALYRMLCIPGV